MSGLRPCEMPDSAERDALARMPNPGGRTGAACGSCSGMHSSTALSLRCVRVSPCEEQTRYDGARPRSDGLRHVGEASHAEGARHAGSDSLDCSRTGEAIERRLCEPKGESGVDDRARQVLDFAVAKERVAEEFYLRWAERSEDDDVKQLLGELAAEERCHTEKLSHITPEALIAEGMASAEFGLVKELPNVPDEQEMTVLDALSVAIRREEEAVTLYERMRGASTTEEALFAALVEEERRHKHRLELQYALLKSRIDRGRPGYV